MRCLPLRSAMPWLSLVLVGCDLGAPPTADARLDPPSTQPGAVVTADYSAGMSDLDQVRESDYSILFIGNSHTTSHELPKLICDQIRFLNPGKRVYAHVIGMAFLDGAVSHPTLNDEITSRPWKTVILQGQKISTSGRFDYPRDAGIQLARDAKAGGATVYFYAEWALENDPQNGQRHERVYKEMAEVAGVDLIAVDAAWQAARAELPELELYESDGNHQSTLGAFLTACVITARLTDQPAGQLASFPYAHADEITRQRLAQIAERAIATTARHQKATPP